MSIVKQLLIKYISSKDANELVRRYHYSKKIVNNSQVHFGVFLNDRLEGAMSFGPSMDKKRMANTVTGTLMHNFLELNRMAFSDKLPKNSESRALSIALKMISKQYKNIEWIVTFADGTQCGHGTIYQAVGFKLIGIKKNTSMLKMPNGEIISDKSLNDNIDKKTGRRMASIAKESGAKPLKGFQLKYIYFLNKDSINRLSVPILKYNSIIENGAAMYKGVRIEHEGNAVSFHDTEGGSIPTDTLQKISPVGNTK